MPILILCLVIILVDQFSKFYIQSMMNLGMSIPVIPHIFHITYILNPGAAFGILENQRIFFILIGVFILLAAMFFYPRLRQEKFPLKAGSALLLGGAVGNLIDRIQTGYVVDFFDFRIWPIFNIADIAIVCGVGLIIYTILFKGRMQ
ncbi:signal peptidase II [Propionispira raffinosivorans]|uniref:signal peptidase II n=1 Tax=Propionispira raffinosivorans TaxID=86959 RepID=UPI00037C55A1|nr:signal peptidase II [Propionispira raffinosivorans]